MNIRVSTPMQWTLLGKYWLHFFYGSSDAELDVAKQRTVELIERCEVQDNIALLG